MSISTLLFYIILIGMIITVPFGIIYFIVETVKAKKEGRPRKQNAVVWLIISIFCLLFLILVALFLFWLTMAIVRGM